MAKKPVTVRGSAKVRKELSILRHRFPRALGAALHQEAAIIFAMSQRRSPVDTGRHRSTGTLPPPEFRGGQIIQEIGYGAVYSRRIHENKEGWTFHGEGEQQDNYLRGPFEERLSGIFDRIAKRTKINAEMKIGLTPLPEVKGNQTIGPSRWKDPAFRRAQAAKRRAGRKSGGSRKKRTGTSGGSRRGNK